MSNYIIQDDLIAPVGLCDFHECFKANEFSCALPYSGFLWRCASNLSGVLQRIRGPSFHELY